MKFFIRTVNKQNGNTEIVEIDRVPSKEGYTFDTLSPESCWVENYETHTAVCGLRTGGGCGTATSMYMVVAVGSGYTDRYVVGLWGNTNSQYASHLRNASVSTLAHDFVCQHGEYLPSLTCSIAHSKEEKEKAEILLEEEREKEAVLWNKYFFWKELITKTEKKGWKISLLKRNSALVKFQEELKNAGYDRSLF